MTARVVSEEEQTLAISEERARVDLDRHYQTCLAFLRAFVAYSNVYGAAVDAFEKGLERTP